ncbi:MAG: hypothetical protein ACTSRP_24165 [Candidatus Helarchaeota archaeon]
MVSLRENIFETSSILAWNFLEHLASRYWNNQDKNFLLKITEEKSNDFISKLKETASNYMSNEIKDEDILLIGEYSKRYNIKNLLISEITTNILFFSPVTYRILSMFEKEEILEENDEEKIKKMNLIRNLLLHNGYSLKEISSHKNIDFNPIEFIASYKVFLYRKFLMFLKIIDDHTEFKFGRLILKDDYIDEKRIELEMEKKRRILKKNYIINIKN